MATLSLTTHFTVTNDAASGVDATTITGGSTTTADTITVTNYYDQKIAVADSTLVELWSDSSSVSDFDFLWVESERAVEIQLVCSEGGNLAGNNIENGFCFTLKPGVPFVLAGDDCRNMGNMNGTFNESNYQSEIDTWETNWAADTIDRIECYNGTGASAEVRIFVAT